LPSKAATATGSIGGSILSMRGRLSTGRTSPTIELVVVQDPAGGARGQARKWSAEHGIHRVAQEHLEGLVAFDSRVADDIDRDGLDALIRHERQGPGARNVVAARNRRYVQGLVVDRRLFRAGVIRGGSI
jgi:hypothetical protein